MLQQSYFTIKINPFPISVADSAPACICYRNISKKQPIHKYNLLVIKMYPKTLKYIRLLSELH